MKRYLLAFLLFITLTSFANAQILVGILGGSDATAPVLATCSIAANGTTWTFNFNKAVTCSPTTDCQELTADTSVTGAKTFTYTSGSGTGTIIMEGQEATNSGETAHVDYATAADEIEDAAGNDLDSITAKACTNNSTQSSSFCPGTGLLLCEDFEHDHYCIGTSGDAVCRNTWVEVVGGTKDWTYTAAPLEGVNSYSATVADLNISPAFTTSSEVYVTLQIKPVANTSNHVIAMPRANAVTSGDCACMVYLTSTNPHHTLGVKHGGCATLVDSAQVVTDNTTYYLKLRYKKGSGADGVCQAWMSTDGSTWGAAVGSTATADQVDIAKVSIGSYGLGDQVILDKVKVKTTDITNASIAEP